VYCPFRDASLPVERCEHCRDYAGSALDLDEGRSYVLCRRLTPDAARSLSSARHAYVAKCRPIDASSPADSTPVSQIMGRDVICLREETELDAARARLQELGLACAPVVDRAGRPVGVLSLADPARPTPFAGRRVREGMSRVFFAVPAGTSVAQAAALMGYERVQHLPVLSDDDHVVGLVSCFDVMRFLGRVEGYVVPEPSRERP
jgi:CBS domain-containing protein